MNSINNNSGIEIFLEINNLVGEKIEEGTFSIIVPENNNFEIIVNKIKELFDELNDGESNLSLTSRGIFPQKYRIYIMDDSDEKVRGIKIRLLKGMRTTPLKKGTTVFFCYAPLNITPQQSTSIVSDLNITSPQITPQPQVSINKNISAQSSSDNNLNPNNNNYHNAPHNNAFERITPQQPTSVVSNSNTNSPQITSQPQGGINQNVSAQSSIDNNLNQNNNNCNNVSNRENFKQTNKKIKVDFETSIPGKHDFFYVCLDNPTINNLDEKILNSLRRILNRKVETKELNIINIINNDSILVIDDSDVKEIFDKKDNERQIQLKLNASSSSLKLSLAPLLWYLLPISMLFLYFAWKGIESSNLKKL